MPKESTYPTIAAAANDLLRIIDDPAGTPATSNVAINAGLANLLAGLISDVNGADQLLQLNGSALAPVANLPDATEGARGIVRLAADGGTEVDRVPTGDDSRLAGNAKTANNLSDLASAATARTNLGLGDSATKNTGTGVGTVAAGDDSRIPTSDEKDALTASNLPSTSNPLVTESGLGSSIDTAIINTNRGTFLRHMGWTGDQAFKAIGGDNSGFARFKNGLFEVIHPTLGIIKLDVSLTSSDDSDEPDIEVATKDGRITSVITGDNDSFGPNGRHTVKGRHKRAMGCMEPRLKISSTF